MLYEVITGRHHAQRGDLADGRSHTSSCRRPDHPHRGEPAQADTGGAVLVRAIDRKLLRDLWQMRSQVVTVALVVGSAFSGFAGSFATYYSLEADGGKGTNYRNNFV